VLGREECFVAFWGGKKSAAKKGTGGTNQREKQIGRDRAATAKLSAIE